jgi:DNA-binding MarR family transcriptional regulator
MSEPIARLLAIVFREAVDEMHEELRRRGHEDLRPAHGFVLNLVGEGATTSELATRLGVTKQGAAKLVAGLVSTGYLERRAHASDRRATLISLTPRGRDALAAAADAQIDIEARWAELLGTNEMKTMRNALEHLAARSHATLRPTW